MEALQEAAEIQAQANAAQIAALEAKVTDQETQLAALSAQVLEAQAEREQLKAQVAENLDGWQRARAEFANYKRRVEAERSEVAANAGAEALKRVLPAVDDFERAMQTLPDDLKDQPWVNGVLMVQRKLNAALEQSGITPIATNPGDTFDPNIHEAITHEDAYFLKETFSALVQGLTSIDPQAIQADGIYIIPGNAADGLSEDDLLGPGWEYLRLLL